MNNFDFLSQIKGGKQLTQCNNLSAYVVDVMPDVAENLLAMNFEHNRTVRPSSVKRFADMMKRGEFVDGSQIRLNKANGKYVLVDGQHRLTAISESGQAATMVVVVSEKDTDSEVREEYAKVDSGGILRGLSDVVMALDVNEELPVGTVLMSYAAATRLIAGNFTNHPASTVSRLAIYPVMKEFKQAIYLTREWFGNGRIAGVNTTRGFMRAGALAVAMVTAHYAEAEVAKNFWRASYEDDGLRKNDPRKKLNEFLRVSQSGGGSTYQTKVCAIAAKCWNAYVAGEEIVQLKMPKSMPNIALTPYPLKEEMPTEE